MATKSSNYSTLRPNRQFLQLAKWALVVAVIWIITILVREVEFVNKFNGSLNHENNTKMLYKVFDFANPEPTLSLSNDDEILVDISQTQDLHIQQDLSFTINDGIIIGNKERDCGLPTSCDTNHFAVHLFTGKDNTIYPKLCIDSQ